MKRLIPLILMAIVGTIAGLVNGVNWGLREQTLLGVTGSGKTFTMANLIERWNRPTLILSHNKTLAAQLFAELKEFFPAVVVCRAGTFPAVFSYEEQKSRHRF